MDRSVKDTRWDRSPITGVACSRWAWGMGRPLIALSCGAFPAGLGAQGRYCAADLVFARTEPGQCLGCGSVVVGEDGEQNVFGADVVVAVRPCLCWDRG